MVGVTITGVPIYNADSIFNQDIISPANPNDTYSTMMDECLGTSAEDNVYHYHTFSPCILPPGVQKDYIELCSDNEMCN